MLAILLFAAATAFPSNSHTSWMRPESFRIALGMPQAKAMDVLTGDGYKLEKTEKKQLMFDYSPHQSVTLAFEREKLTSIRFELYLPEDQIGGAFDEVKSYLDKSLGKPRTQKSGTMLVYDKQSPNVMVVRVPRPKAAHALTTLVVRYYAP